MSSFGSHLAPPKPSKVFLSGLSSLEHEQIRSLPAIPAPIIPITATFSNKCKAMQNVSQPARKRGQGCVLTVSSGSIKCYCVCRQLLTVHFVSEWVSEWVSEVGNCGERNLERRRRRHQMDDMCAFHFDSQEPRLIKLTSDALPFPLINGCRNHTKMH